MGDGGKRYSRADVEERTSDTFTAASPDRQSAASSGARDSWADISSATRIGCLADILARSLPASPRPPRLLRCWSRTSRRHLFYAHGQLEKRSAATAQDRQKAAHQASRAEAAP